MRERLGMTLPGLQRTVGKLFSPRCFGEGTGSPISCVVLSAFMFQIQHVPCKQSAQVCKVGSLWERGYLAALQPTSASESEKDGADTDWTVLVSVPGCAGGEHEPW